MTFLTIKYRSGIFLTMFILFLLPASSDITNLPWYTEKCWMIITKRLLKAPQQGGSGKENNTKKGQADKERTVSSSMHT